jgi:hypothetical protein
MVHVLRAPTATLLHDKIAESLLFGKAIDLDDVNSEDVQMHNVIAEADSFQWNYDTKRLWTTRARWNTMVRQYIDPEALRQWLDLVENKFPSNGRGLAVLRTNTVKSKEGGAGRTRTWGSCMLSISYRQKPWPQLTLHSRTCYLGYLSVLDLTVAHVCARLVATRLGITPPDMKFVWMLEMAQFHGFRSIAYPLGGSDELFTRFVEHDRRRETYPGVFITRRQYDRLCKLDDDGVKYGDMTFASHRRVRARWHMEMEGPEYAAQFIGGTRNPKLAKPSPLIPSTPTDTLDFSPIGVFE